MDKSCILSPCFSTGVALGWNQLPPWRARPRTWVREYSVKVSSRCQYERVLPSLLEKKKWKKEITYWYRVKYNHLLRFPGQTQSFEKNSCTVVESALEPFLEMWLFVTKCVWVWRGLLVSSPVMRVSFPFDDIPGRGLMATELLLEARSIDRSGELRESLPLHLLFVTFLQLEVINTPKRHISGWHVWTPAVGKWICQTHRPSRNNVKSPYESLKEGVSPGQNPSPLGIDRWVVSVNLLHRSAGKRWLLG